MSERTDYAKQEATDRGYEEGSDEYQDAYDQAYDSYYESKQSDAMAMMMGAEAPVAEKVDWEAIYKNISAYNEEKYRRLYPESIIAGAQTGEFFNQWYRGQAKETDLFNQQQAGAMNEWLKAQGTDLNKYLRGEAAVSNQWTLGQAGAVNQWMMPQVAAANQFNAEQFYGAMEKALPGVLGTAQSYKASVDQMLAGELPDVVKREIAQGAAERGISGGVYGPAAGNAQLRDLGINRLQYLQAGQAGAQGVAGMARNLMAPLIQTQVAQPNIIQNPMINPSFASPQATYGQIANAGGIQSNIMGSIMGLTTMAPQAGIAAEQQNAANALQASMANSQLQYAKAMSSLGYYENQQNAAQQQSMFNEQMSQAKMNSWLNFGANIFGSVAGMFSFGK